MRCGLRRPEGEVCPSGTAHGPCPRRRVDRIPSIPGAVMGRSPNAAERMDARELPTVKNVHVLLSCRKDVGPTSLRPNVRLRCHLRSSSSTPSLTLTRKEISVDAEVHAAA